MVLITNKTSNILQDIDTLHLFARVVGEYCRTLDEKEVSNNAFELLAVFDEIISLGYRENVNLGQLRTISAMESHDERIQAEIEKNKEKEAKEEIKRKEKQIDMQKREAAKRAASGSAGGYGSGGYGGSSFNNNQSGGFNSQSSYNQGGFNSQSNYNQGGFNSQSNYNQGGFNSQGQNQSQPSFSGGSFATAPAPQFNAPTVNTSLGKGMQLGSKNRQSSLFETIKADEGIADSPPVAAAPQITPQLPSPVHEPVHEEAVHVVVEEKVSAVINRDGGVQSFELNGSMTLKINDASKARLKVNVSHPGDPSIQFKTHPNVDKGLWANQSVIGLRDPSRPFPVSQPLGILRWRQSSTSESSLPLTVNCWPSPTGNGSCDVNIEYELQADIELQDVALVIPYP